MRTPNSRRTNVLVADDEEVIRRLLKYNLEKIGVNPVLATNGREAMNLMSDNTVAALIDLKMPQADGLEVLQFIKEKYPNTPVIMISAVGQVKEAVAAMKKGAFEYVTKPFDLDELLSLLQQAVRLGKTARENVQLRQAVGQSPPRTKFVGSSELATRILKEVDTIAPLNSTVLITGESGCGKGLLARMIHYSSQRAALPFIAVSCPSLPRDLLESELFGHEKGAFTGAVQQRIGRAEMADGGTLFLDEIGDLPMALQPKLLTFLQERVFQRVGGSEDIEVDVRVIAATNHELTDKVARREFREDLFFRLNVLPIRVPPLRERRSDIPDLITQVLQQIATTRAAAVCTVMPDAMKALQSYNWPGNVRELENIMERASAFCTNAVIALQDLPPEVVRATGGGVTISEGAELPAVALDDLEKLAIDQALKRCGGNKAESVRQLGITEKTIYNKMARYGLR